MNVLEVTRRARAVDEENTVRQLAIRTHAALMAYFDGVDPTGIIKGKNTDVYRAFLVVVEGGDSAELNDYEGLTSTGLEATLEDALRDAGFTDETGTLALPGRESYSELPDGSIGPLLPGMLAMLEVEYEIDSTEAVRAYRSGSVDAIESGATTARTDPPSLQEWEDALRTAPGFEPNAAAYVYVLELERLSDESTWFYVGKSEGGFSGLRSRTRSHATNFENQRVVQRDAGAILRGDYNASMDRPGRTHRVVGPERIVSLSPAHLGAFNVEGARSCHIREIERRTAYEVALEYETTNVLGGK